MKKTMKRVLALFCAVMLTMTSVGIWNSDSVVQAAADPYVTLPGYTTVTVDDFVGVDEATMEGKRYEETGYYALKELESFDKTLLTLKVKYEDNVSRLEVAGKDDSSFFMLYPTSDGSNLTFIVNKWDAAESLVNPNYIPQYINVSDTNISSFLNTEFVLQMSFAYVDTNSDEKADALEVHFYINGTECPI